MKTSYFALLGLAFPNSEIYFTPLGAEIKDTKGELIGFPDKEIFVLREEYTYYKQAKQALEQNGINHKTQSVKEALYGENS